MHSKRRLVPLVAHLIHRRLIHGGFMPVSEPSVCRQKKSVCTEHDFKDRFSLLLLIVILCEAELSCCGQRCLSTRFSKMNANTVWPSDWIRYAWPWRFVFIGIISLQELQQMQRLFQPHPNWIPPLGIAPLRPVSGLLPTSSPHFLPAPSTSVEEVIERPQKH